MQESAILASGLKGIPSPFRLFSRYAVFGLIGFILLSFILFQIWMHVFERYLIQGMKETKARYTSALVGHVLTEEDFHGVKKGSAWNTFGEKMAPLFFLPEVVRVKVYDRDGVMIWSDLPELVEQSPPAKKNPELLEALEGHVEAEISRLTKEEHHFERGTFRSLMELYVPIYLGQEDRPIGVAEVYMNIDPLFETVRNAGGPIGFTVAAGMGLLLFSSFFGLGRAVGVIHKQSRELSASHASPEEKVEQRKRELSALYDVTTTVSQSLELEPVLQEVIEKITEIFHFDATRIYLFNPQMDELHVRASFETKPEFWAQARVFRRGQGNVGKVAETGEPLIFEDIHSNPQYQQLSHTKNTQKAGFSFFAAFPIKTKLRTVGTIVCIGRMPRCLTFDEVRLITSMTDHIGVAVGNAALFEETVKRADQLSALHAVTATVSQSLDLGVVLNESIKKVLEVFKFDAARIFLLDRESNQLEVRAHKNLSEELSHASSYRLDEGIIGKVWQSGQMIAIDNMEIDPKYRQMAIRRSMFQAGFRSQICFPIRVKEKIFGVGNYYCYRPHHFTPEELQLLSSIASQIGVAIEKASLFEEIKNKTTELESINRDLHEANQAKGDFLAAMSHELRTPINVIIGNADLVRDGIFGDINEKQKDALEKVHRYSQMLLRLVNEVLTLSRTEVKEVSLDLSTFEVNEVIAHTQSYVEQLNRNGRLKFLWEVKSDLPPITTDALKLEEILQNLIGNAFKYTPEGRIEVRVQDLRERHRIEFAVSDTGIGIDKKDLPSIFEQFHQVKGAHTGSTNGVGLGLSIVKKYLEMMHGDIHVKSQPGKGSTFTFILPYSV